MSYIDRNVSGHRNETCVQRRHPDTRQEQGRRRTRKLPGFFGLVPVIVPCWMEDVDDPAPGYCPSRMGVPARNDDDITLPESPGHALHGHLENSLNDVCDLLVRMAVHREDRTLLYVPVGNGHMVRMDEPDPESGNQFFPIDIV